MLVSESPVQTHAAWVFVSTDKMRSDTLMLANISNLIFDT